LTIIEAAIKPLLPVGADVDIVINAIIDELHAWNLIPANILPIADTRKADIAAKRKP